MASGSAAAIPTTFPKPTLSPGAQAVAGAVAAPAPAVSNPQPTPAPVPVAGMYPGGNSYGGIPVQRQAPATMPAGTFGGMPARAYNPNGPMVDSGHTMGGMPVKVPAAQLAGGAMWNDQGRDQARMDVYNANRQNNARAYYDQPRDRDSARLGVGIANRQNNVQPGPFDRDSWRGQVARANGFQRY